MNVVWVIIIALGFPSGGGVVLNSTARYPSRDACNAALAAQGPKIASFLETQENGARLSAQCVATQET